ncbi:MAG: hypothetical protein IJR96_01470 [Pseudobutyrivibrio sp.]|nr:hypothetical protein [Pseudobutyrivibrio sp.]
MKNKIIAKIMTLSFVFLICLSLGACVKSDDTTASVDEELEVTVGDVEYPSNDDGKIISQIMEEEDSEEAIIGYANDAAPDIDIEGCDTFTQIVDRKLSPGMGYANVNIGDINALIICSGAYDNMDGNMAAIDGTIYIYKDGIPYLAGKVCSGGTAYPLTIKDGKLMSASNHWVAKYLIVDDQVMMIEHGVVEYDTNGNGSYSYDRIDDFSDGSEIGEPEDMVNNMFDEMGSGEIINFDIVK